MGLKGGSQTQTSQVKVPAYLENELKYGIGESRRLYDQGPGSYEELFAGLDPLQEEAMQGILAQARGGTSQYNSAKDFIQQTLDSQSGQNPYLQQMMDIQGRQANNAIMSQFNSGGRFGSGANAAAAAKAITEATTPLMFDQYNKDQAMKFQAANMAQQFSDYDYANLGKIASVGDVYQQMAQSRLDYDANKEGAWLDQYMARINGSAANNLKTTTQTTNSGGGGLMSILGPALMIGGMFASGGALNPGTAGGLSQLLGFGSAASGAAQSIFRNQDGSFSPIIWNK